MAVFGKIFWGGFWRVWAPKVAVSDFDLLETLNIQQRQSTMNFFGGHKTKVLRLEKPNFECGIVVTGVQGFCGIICR